MFRSLLRARVVSSFVASAVLIGHGDAASASTQQAEGPGTESSTSAQGPNTAPPQTPAIRFAFKSQSWDQVLDWFSRTTGLPVVREVPVPSGTVDYLSPRAYDLPEALRLLNILLQTQGVMLRVEADRLHLQKLEDMKRENIPTFSGSIPESVTDDQIVTLLLPLTNATAEAVSEQLKDLVAAYGSVTPLKQQNAVILVETAGQVRRLQRIVDEIDREDVENIVEYIQIRHAKAEELINSLKALMGERVVEYVINPQNNQRVKLDENRLAGLTLAADERTNSIIARGTRSRIDRVRETIELLDVPRAGDGPRTVRSFTLTRETADGAKRKLDQIFAALPKDQRPAVIDLDEPGRIAVAGTPDLVAEALSVLSELDGGDGRAAASDRAVMRLPVEHLDAAAAITALRPLLSPRQQSTISLAPGPDGRSILAAGPDEALTSLQGLLTLVDRAKETPREVRYAPLSEADGAAIIAKAEEIDRLRRPAGDAEVVEAEFDADRGQVRVVGAAKAIDRWLASLAQAREALRPRPQVLQLRLEHATPSRVASEFSRLARQLLDPRDGTTFTPPVAEPVDALSLLVVTAAPDQVESVRSIVDTLDRPSAGDVQVRVIKVDGTDAASLVDRAVSLWEQLVPEEDRIRLGVPQIQIDERSGSLLVIGRNESLASFERAVQEARRLEAPPRSGRMLAVRQAGAADLVEPLAELLATAGPVDPSRTVDPVQIVAVEPLNSLWVVGEATQLALAEQFLQRLDVPGGGELPPLKLLAVRSADAVVIANLLTERYSARSASERRERPVTVDAEIGGNTLAVTAPPEILAEIESLVEEINDAGRVGGEGREIKIFPLKVGRADDLARTIDQMFPEPTVPVDSRGRPRPDLKLPREVVVRAHAPTNSLIVDAPGTRMEDFARLVEQLDRQEAAPETEIRTYRMNRSRPEAIASTLRELATGGHLGNKTDARGSGAISIGIEPNTGSLVVSGPPEIFERIEQVIAEIDGPRPGPPTDLRIFRLASSRADSLEPTLRQILLARMREVIPASAGRPEELLQITIDRKGNALVVAAPTPILELAEALVKDLDSGESLGASTVRVRPLSFADASQVAQSLSLALPGLTSPATGGPVEVRVIAAPGANALMLIGAPIDLDEVEQLIEPLDLKPSTDSVDAESFQLQYASAAVIAPLVQRVLADQQQSDPRVLIERMRRSRGQIDLTPPVRVEAEIRTNTLLVSGPPQTVALAKSLIARLDVPDSSADRSYALFVPTKADPAKLVQSATRVLDATRPAGVRSTLELIADPQAGAVIAMGTEEETARAEALLGTLDLETPEAPVAVFRTIEVEHGDAAAISGTLQALLRDRGRWPESLQQALRAGRPVPEPQISADAAANRLTINAPEALMPFAVEVIAQLDQPRGEGTVETRVFALQRAKANEVSGAIRQALDHTFRNQPTASRPTLVPEPSSNSLVASGTAEQLAAIAELVAPLDESVGETATVRTVFLAHARAEQVAPLVKELLDPEPQIDTRGLPGWLQIDMLRSRQQRGTDTVRAVADRRLNAVVLTGPVAELDAAERMVRELDQRAAVATAGQTLIEVIAIRNGDAASIAEGLESMFAQESSEAPPVIRTDASGSALLVRADARQMERIRSLAAQLDRAASGSRQLRTVAIDPARADAAEVARLLDRMLEQGGESFEVVSLEELLSRYPDASPQTPAP